jgi:hypothetical protein
MTVCDDCLTAAYDEGVNGYEAQASMMIDLGDEWQDHECVELELEVKIRCDCGCHGKEKRRLRASNVEVK